MVVAVEEAVAAGCSMVHTVDDSKQVVVAEGVAVGAGSAGTAAVDSKAAYSATAAGSKISQTR